MYQIYYAIITLSSEQQDKIKTLCFTVENENSQSGVEGMALTSIPMRRW